MQGRKQRERHGRTGNSRNAHLCKGGSSDEDTDGRATLATPTCAREEAARTRTDGQLSRRPPMQGRKQRGHGRTGNSHDAHLCTGGSSEDTDGRATLTTPTYAREEAARV